MGVGLHSYGFTDGRAKWLAVFVMSQLVAMAFGMLIGATPKSVATDAE
jgi:hypothetical protein